MPFSEEELERYARHVVLHEIGGAGQQRLQNARIVVIGAGGLGSPAILYLAAAGIGTIGVVDHDAVSLSNLQRQVLHLTEEVGEPKVASAARAIHRINPNVGVRRHQIRLTEENAAPILEEYDIALDGSDNFETRYLVNRTATLLGMPLISGAIGRWEGQISVFHPAEGTPCYECVFPEAPEPGLVPACAEAGVLGALAGVIGSLQAVEAVKLVTGAGEPLYNRLLMHDSLTMDFREISLKPRPDCPVCGAD